MDRMQATRRKYPMVGGLADLLAAGTSPQRTQQMRGLMEFLQVPDIAQTLDRVSYGEPLTTGAGMTTKLRPEAESTLMAALGMLPAGRPAEAGAMALGRAGERMAERVVPQVMERGGLPAEMLGAMAQGSRSKMFIGPEAKTWDQKAAMQASRMEKQGAKPEEIWAATGTARGPDNLWRQEISDKDAVFKIPSEIAAERDAIRARAKELSEKVKPNRTGQKDMFPAELTAARRPIKQEVADLERSVSRNYGYGSDPKFMGNFAPIAYNHPELFKAYPQLVKDVIRQGSTREPGYLGSYDKGQLDVYLPAFYQPGGARSTATHEFQHAVQDIEKFAPGGNPTQMHQLGQRAMERVVEIKDELSGLVGIMDNDLLPEARRAAAKARYNELLAEREVIRPVAQGQSDPYNAYRALQGETEARLTQRRLDLTEEERRKNFPFRYTGDTGYGLDTPLNQLINLRPIETTGGLMGNIGR
jgi:hypothetical protein